MGEAADSVVAGDFAAAVARVFVEAASMVVFVACLRHAVAARLSALVYLVATGSTRIPEFEACRAASGTAQAEQWFQEGDRASPTLTVVRAALRPVALAAPWRLQLRGYNPNPAEANGDRSAQIVLLP